MSEAERTAPDKSRSRCIAVRVGTALYGLPVEHVQEVIGMRPITRVFHAPAALAGVTNLRGEVLPVIELGLLLGGDAELPTSQARIVVVRESSGQKRRAGLRVDELSGLRDLPKELAPAPSTAGERARAAIRGVIPEAPPCAVLEVPSLLDSPLLAALSGRGESGAQ
ncbi:MAG: chemotaxis protein CheW [Polyangiaceae bacterium]